MRFATLILLTFVVTLGATRADASMLGSASNVKQSLTVVNLQAVNQFSLERLQQILVADTLPLSADTLVRPLNNDDSSLSNADTMLVAGKKKENKTKKDKKENKEKDLDRDKQSPAADDNDGDDDD